MISGTLGKIPKIFLVFLIIASLIVTPVLAETITGYASFSTESDAILSGETSLFTNTSDSGYGITLAIQTPYSSSEGTTTDFSFTYNDGLAVTGTITDTPTSIFGGNHIIAINGGTTVTTSYTSVPLVGPFLPSTYFYYFLENGTSGSSGRALYFVASTQGRHANAGQSEFTGLTADIFNTNTLDTGTDAYITASDITSNPITGISLSNSAGGTFTSAYYECSISHLTTVLSEVGYNDRQENLIALLYAAALALVAFLKTAGTFVASGMWVVSFFLAAKTFIIIIAVYEAVVLVLAIDEQDDIIKVVKRWWRYQVGLWKFFMMLIKDIKEILKWW